MSDNLTLLVVDDEEVICDACHRVFSCQGFRVETTSDAVDGLGLAIEKDYAAILLDVKMPVLNGIQFLERLRKKKPDVPVIVITGYPNMRSATSAMRLGAVDYITKPFTPEDITQAVQKLLRQREARARERPAAAAPDNELGTCAEGGLSLISEGWTPEEIAHVVEGLLPHRVTLEGEGAPGAVYAGTGPWSPASKDLGFWDESWYQRGKDGSVRVGALPTRSRRGTIQAIHLPRLFDTVYQGLPLLGLTFSDKPQLILPSSISGAVVAVNKSLMMNPSALWDDPGEIVWIACVSPSRLEDELANCRLRRVLLVNSDEVSAREQSSQLSRLGCQVQTVREWEQLASPLRNPDHKVVVIDAASLGERGPELVRRVNATAPSARIVVIASPKSKHEAAYRAFRILFYAVEPFIDNEIVDILDAAFRPPAPQVRPQTMSSQSISSLRLSTANGKRVHLVSEGGLLRHDDGLGEQVIQRLTDRHYQIETTAGPAFITPAGIQEAANACDRLLVLQARNTGHLPGNLIRDTRGEFVPAAWGDCDKVTLLIIQPPPDACHSRELDLRTTAALAEHIAQEMVLC